MKLKKTKKLQLNRETLTQLDNSELHQVAGGATVGPGCWSGGRRTCATCELTCTTNEC